MDDEQERKSVMAGLVAANPSLAPKGVVEIGYMLAEFLRGSVADSGTAVDTGCGFGAFDLWVKVGGEEYYVTVKKRLQQDPPQGASP